MTSTSHPGEPCPTLSQARLREVPLCKSAAARYEMPTRRRCAGCTLLKIALYGGTFDPIHHGHLILAREALERLALDRVIFIPAAQSPHKLHTPPAPPRVRLEMVRAALAGEPRFACDDAEVERPGPSFTIETVERYTARFPDAEIYYFIGHDNVRELPTWRRIQELRQLVRFVVFERDGCDLTHEFAHITRQIDISATELRTRVASGASIRYLVPETVRVIIDREKLYQGTAP